MKCGLDRCAVTAGESGNIYGCTLLTPFAPCLFDAFPGLWVLFDGVGAYRLQTGAGVNLVKV